MLSVVGRRRLSSSVTLEFVTLEFASAITPRRASRVSSR